MHRITYYLASIVLLFLVWCVPSYAVDVRAIAYHDIVEEYGSDEDATSMGIYQLANQFSWMRANGWTPVSIKDIWEAHEGKRTLPPKAVLLTFDDGYAGLYTKVYPLLKHYNYPAVMSIVGKWMDTPEDGMVPYNGGDVPRSRFVSWKALKEMQDSGLVEVASHSYDLHQGVFANPQGNTQPSAITRVYDSATGQYETESEYLARVESDLRKNSELIRRHLGKAPMVMTWPYGRYSRATQEMAARLGMPITMTLDDGLNVTRDDKTDTGYSALVRINRYMPRFNPSIRDFAAELRAQEEHLAHPRVVHADLDYVYDPDPAQQEKNLSALLDRVKASGANTVFLQAFDDRDGSGQVSSVYFPNSQLPVTADLFNRVSWQLSTRAHVRVFAWMPLLSLEFPEGHPASDESHKVVATVPNSHTAYKRLSPFSPVVRSAVIRLFNDLAAHAPIAGVVIHDDATLSDWEDDSPWARQAYAMAGLPESVEGNRASPSTAAQWLKLKTTALTSLSLEAIQAAEKWRKPLLSARNYYALPIQDGNASGWFSQNLQDGLNSYDFVAVMAMPYMENAATPNKWLADLVASVAKLPDGLKRTIFEIQTKDWRTGENLPGKTIAEHFKVLVHEGALGLGYYPDDFIQGKPELADFKTYFSIKDFPSQ